ncbi:MAG: Ger(x)C family spore germination protein [Clostridiales bacterium]|nr:Ger(x)C family spore germination protein [Clostridiales bacterium]
MKKILISLILLVSLLLTGCYKKVPIEKLSIITGVGFDVEKESKEIINSSEYLIFRGDRQIDRGVGVEKGKTINEADSDRQLNLKKNYLLGTIRVYVISEDRAKLGIMDIIDTCIRDQERNLNTIMVVSKGNTKEIFELTPKEANTMADEIKDLIDSSYSSNFFTNNASVKELANMYYQEGRRIILPVIEKSGNTIKISGLAVFDKDKLKEIIEIEDTIFINLLRNSDVRGSIAITLKDYNNAVDVNCISKRKVKVDEVDGRLKYTIKLNIKGEVKLKTLNIEDEDEKKIIAKIKSLIEENIKENTKKVIDKAKYDYKIDVFDIQKYAVAKYGRSNIDKIQQQFENSEIDVEVKVKICSTGRYKK